MTQTDIAFLLADAADEVEIGIAPVQAVMRGGRRRKARRWAVAAATAVVLAGSTGATLALTGMPGGHGDRGAEVATQPASPEARHVDEPQSTELAWGTYRGKQWSVGVDVWSAPRNVSEAIRQFGAMSDLGLKPSVDKSVDLIGKTSYFVSRRWGTERKLQVMYNTAKDVDHLTGTDLGAIATRFSSDVASDGRLVVGAVAKTARQVTCHWKDGRTTVANRVPKDHETHTTAAIRPAAGFPGANWFVCVAPEGTSYASAEVTK
ncbi:hypothetical protein ACIPSA_02520 [Streptomyces sp. NPDC086549]|uniref:hypothetical protein n=1 Tax=Streptomyces sp. NPDC086549 TaxID=3365752 RepID=UPI0038180F0C